MATDPRLQAFKEAAAPKAVKLPPENSNTSLNEIKRTLKKKEKMRRCQYYLCDHCDQPIYEAQDGYVIHGNIYVADPNCRGGVVGNNFPEVNPGEKIEVTDVRETVYCKRCFIEAIGLFEPKSASGGAPMSSDCQNILDNLGVQNKPNKPKIKFRPVTNTPLDTDDFMRELNELDVRGSR
jgi:hypothetical protein